MRVSVNITRRGSDVKRHGIEEISWVHEESPDVTHRILVAPLFYAEQHTLTARRINYLLRLDTAPDVQIQRYEHEDGYRDFIARTGVDRSIVGVTDAMARLTEAVREREIVWDDATRCWVNYYMREVFLQPL
jgi:hypothetical protein